MRTIAYCRVSTADQTTANQIMEIERAGYTPDVIYTDTISGKVPAQERPDFGRLLDTVSRMTGNKRLVVTKLDRLGRDAADIMTTVRKLSDVGCAVRVLQLGDLDLASAPGRLVMTTLAAVAELERDLIVERTHAGLERARRDGKRLGRPPVTTDASAAAIRAALSAGESVSAVARRHGVSRATVIRVRDAG